MTNYLQVFLDTCLLHNDAHMLAITLINFVLNIQLKKLDSYKSRAAILTHPPLVWDRQEKY